MKKIPQLLCIGAALCLFIGMGIANAGLVTIGTATYGGSDYKLIYDNDDNGHGGGGLVWLDYSHPGAYWGTQNTWATTIGSQLTVTLFPGYTSTIDWTTGWRLPETVDGTDVYGYEGDPDNDGIYTYTSGYNLANSEMGQLFYTELGNQGRYDTDGTDLWAANGNSLTMDTGDFEHLVESTYWSGTEYAAVSGYVWWFRMGSGNNNDHAGQQDRSRTSHNYYGLAVHPGQVSAVPIPGAVWLLGSGLLGLAAARRRRKNSRGVNT